MGWGVSGSRATSWRRLSSCWSARSSCFRAASWRCACAATLAWALYRLDQFDLAAEQFEQLPGQGALVAQLRALGDRVPYRLPPSVSAITLPLLGTDPLPVVSLTIGSQEHAFVVDTGSSQMVIDSSLLEGLHLPDFGTREVTFAGGQRAAIGHTLLPRVMMGDATIHDVPAEIMEVRRHAPQIAGFVGTNLLQRFHVLFDWQAETMALRVPRAGAFAEWGAMQATPLLFMDSHLLLAPLRLNTHETMAFLATGLAGGSFVVPRSTVVQAGLASDEQAMEGVGAGGSAAFGLVRAEQMCLGGWCRDGMEGLSGAFPAELEWRYGFRVGAMVSHEFLKGERLGFDFQGGQLFLS